MRTPNAACLICAKPLYRRPGETARVRYAACMAHRAEAQKVAGITDAQQAGLAMARKKGFNYRNGRIDTAEVKAKRAATLKAFWAENEELALARGAKTRGELNVRWKGGVTKLNKSVRQMTENRRWMDAIKERDGYKCVRCGSPDRLESHHIIGIAEVIESNGVTSRDDARKCDALWDLANGETLCESCHYAEHGRKRAA